MASIVLCTINARYIHAAFGLRYLRANLGELRDSSEIIEFGPQLRAADMAERLLAGEPKIIGLGVYIWNARASLELVSVLRTVAPHVKLILGGPEISHEVETQELTALVDHVVVGEGEDLFVKLCRGILSGRPSLTKIHRGDGPDLATMQYPYDEYTDEDLSGRIVYVEASRGCPFRCEFCLSSLDKSVRPFPLETFLAQLDQLLARGLRRFKFVDRTFNLKIETSAKLLQFFLERYTDGLFLHFEMIPDRLPVELRELISQFPPGVLQFEVGIQSFNDEVNQRISRRQDFARLRDNLSFLKSATGVHVHADLIIGLPGETLESFGRGLNELVALGPQEIQVGILKRLRGAPIARHEQEFELRFDSLAPYEILSTRDISFAQMQAAKRMALIWDRVVNQGFFRESVATHLFADGEAFANVMQLSQDIYQAHGRVHGLSLDHLGCALVRFISERVSSTVDAVIETVHADLVAAGHQLHPRVLDFRLADARRAAPKKQSPHAGPPPRQLRHLLAAGQHEAATTAASGDVK